MDAATRLLVRRRAADRCEYCRIHEDQDPPWEFHVEHIIARQHRGGDEPDNLALSCHHCNLHKGPKLSGVDPVTGQIVPLFHPRRQRWSRHFRWEGPYLRGRTRAGRATVEVLGINLAERASLREQLIEAGEFPPS